MSFNYRKSVLIELARHGVMPREDTPPELIYDFLMALYSYEIRALKARLKAGAIPQAEYSKHVERLRKRYPILSLPVIHWIIGE